MSHWEYKVVPIRGKEEAFFEDLIQLGKEGWELICLTSHDAFAFFKREVFDLGDLE